MWDCGREPEYLNETHTSAAKTLPCAQELWVVMKRMRVQIKAAEMSFF